MTQAPVVVTNDATGALRLGTWNVEYAAGPDENEARLRLLLAADCDVLVLTETHDDLALPYPYTSVATAGRPGVRAGSRWVTIWTRLPLVRQLPTADPVRSVAAELTGRVVCYGTVLPWHSDQGDDPRAGPRLRNWSEFMRVLVQQGQEWRALRSAHPRAVLIVAGDLNQSLGGRHYYGTKVAAGALRDALAAAALTCMTDARHEKAGVLQHPPIDHICVGLPGGELVRVAEWAAWEGQQAGVRLSDHSAVVVSVRV